MPVYACNECSHKQIVPGAMVGLTVECEECGTEFVANTKSEARKKTHESAGLEVNPIAILKAVGLIGGLLLAVGLVFLIVVLIVRTPDPKPETPPIQVQKPPIKQSPFEEETRRDEADRKIESSKRLIEIGAFLCVGLVVLIYLSLIVWCGSWVASDAASRGMSGLGWAWFYFTFQALGRIMVVPLAILPTLLVAKEIGPWMLLAGEPLAWAGLFVYGLSRRSGRIDRCGHCKQKRLSYLTTCPVCSVKDLQAPKGK